MNVFTLSSVASLSFCLLWDPNLFSSEYSVVSNNSDNNVSIIDITTIGSASVVNTLAVGANPFGVAITPDRSYALVTNTTDNNVSIIDITTIGSASVANTVAVGSSPEGIGVWSTPPPSPPSPAAVAAIQTAIQQSLELVNSTINTSVQDAQTTGITAATTGTYPDTTNTYIIDSTTPMTTGVNLPPPWCY